MLTGCAAGTDTYLLRPEEPIHHSLICMFIQIKARVTTAAPLLRSRPATDSRPTATDSRPTADKVQTGNVRDAVDSDELSAGSRPDEQVVRELSGLIPHFHLGHSKWTLQYPRPVLIVARLIDVVVFKVSDATASRRALCHLSLLGVLSIPQFLQGSTKMLDGSRCCSAAHKADAPGYHKRRRER